MADSETTAEGAAPLDPVDVSERTFPTAFRGFDPVQVRSFLGRIADELRRLHEQEEALRASLAEAEASAATAGSTSSAAPPRSSSEEETEAAAQSVEEAKVEAERLVREARDRVATLGTAATAEATRVLDEARAEAARLRATATDDLKGRFEEAEATAVRKIAEAEREAAAIRVKAREEADATIEAARDRGREMVAEAQGARERMLADLAKRKRSSQAQLEQLRAGRDRLLDTLKVARRSIDEMTNRFDANEGGSATSLTPPASGTPSGSVTTTPGAASTEARPRAASSPSGASDAPARPVRTRAVAIGEAPASARPSIAAPQATAAEHAAQEVPAAGEDARTEEPGGADAVGASPVPAPAASGRTEERRSSALRILRRNKPADPARATPPLIGRDSPAEGVRIIGRRGGGPPVSPEPEREPEAEPAPAGNAPADDVPPAVVDEPVEVTGTATEAAAPEELAEAAPGDRLVDPNEPTVSGVSGVEGDEVDLEALLAEADRSSAVAGQPGDSAEEAVPEPLAREEIRPRIEDLFARIRADREAATASAREVLAGAPSTGDAERAAGRPEESAPPQAAAIAASTDADEHRLQARDAITEPLAGQLTKRLKRALQDEQNASLDRLRTSRGPTTVHQVLAPPDDQCAPYRHLAGPFLEAAARGGASASKFGAVAVATNDLASQLATDLAGALRSRLDAVLAAGAADDLDVATLGERISAVYREWKVQKLERLAMHYLVAAHERGGFLAQPEGTPLRWLVDDEGPCPDCEDNALAGPTPRGESFPTGQLHPPAHVGCRCLLTPASR